MNRWEWLFVVAALSTSLAITAHFVPLVEGKGKTYETPSVRTPVRTPLPTPTPAPTPSESPQAVRQAPPQVVPYTARSGSASLSRIRACESHGNYQTNTGNGYYGAYQYKRSTWNGYGGYSSPEQA